MGAKGSKPRRATVTNSKSDDPVLRRLNQGLRALDAELTASSFESVAPYTRSELEERDQEALCGRGRGSRGSPVSKVAVLYLASAWSDCEHERELITAKLLPFLRKWLERTFAFSLDILDPAVRYEVPGAEPGEALEHLAGECRRISISPLTIVLCGEKLGGPLLPATVPQGAFQALVDDCSREEVSMLQELYQLDENSVPECFALQAVVDEDRRRADLALSALAGLKLRGHVDYTLGRVVEGALTHGNMPAATARCLWFQRTYDDVPGGRRDQYPLLFEEEDSPAATALTGLHSALQALAPEQRADAHVPWANGGIDKEMAEHREYLAEFALDFCRRTMELLGRDCYAAQQKQVHSTLYAEAVAHLHFARNEAKAAMGTSVPAAVRQYLASPQSSPLVLQGKAGQGRSCAAAVAFAIAAEESESAVVPRFVGLTERSQTLEAMLSGLGQHLCALYGHDPSDYVPTALPKLRRAVRKWLSWANSYLSLVLIIDGADDSPEYRDNIADLDWLPTTLPPNVHVIFTCSSAEEWANLVTLRFDRPADVVSLRPADPDEATRHIQAVLGARGRTLSGDQLAGIIEAYSRSQSAFVLRALVEMAAFQRSWDRAVSLTYLTTPVLTQTLDLVLESLEDAIGEAATETMLGAISCSRNGLSPAELVALLSEEGCAKRNPGLAVAMLQQRAGFLFRLSWEQGLLQWRHEFVKEAALKRYAGNAVDVAKVWSRLSSMFLRLSATSGVSARVASELPWLMANTNDVAGLERALGNLDLFSALQDVTDEKGNKLLPRFWKDINASPDICARYMLTLQARRDTYLADVEAHRPALLRTAQQAFHLSCFLRDNNDKFLAAEFFQLTLDVRDKVFPEDHKDTVHVLEVFVNCLVQLKQYTEAKPLCERAIAARRQATDKQRSLAALLLTLGNIHKELGDGAAAIANWSDALTLYRPEESKVFGSRIALAQELVATGEHAEAVKQLNIVVSHMTALQLASYTGFQARLLLAAGNEALKRNDDALRVYQDLLPVGTTLKGETHPDVVMVAKKIKRLSRK